MTNNLYKFKASVHFGYTYVHVAYDWLAAMQV